jgi:hypothetical protein
MINSDRPRNSRARRIAIGPIRAAGDGIGSRSRNRNHPAMER